MKATNSSGNFKATPLPKPATVFCRCYSVIDLGTVPVPAFVKGGQILEQRKIWISWELPTLKAVFNEERGPQPFVVSEELTASTNEKANLRILINRWRNKDFTQQEIDGFDPATMIGKVGFLSFVVKPKGKYKGQTITNPTNENCNLKLNGIMPVPEGIERPKAVNEYFNWDWDEVAEKGFDKDKFEKIPKFLQVKMATSKEFHQYAKGYNVSTNADQQKSITEEQNNATDDKIETIDGGDW